MTAFVLATVVSALVVQDEKDPIAKLKTAVEALLKERGDHCPICDGTGFIAHDGKDLAACMHCDQQTKRPHKPVSTPTLLTVPEIVKAWNPDQIHITPYGRNIMPIVLGRVVRTVKSSYVELETGGDVTLKCYLFVPRAEPAPDVMKGDYVAVCCRGYAPTKSAAARGIVFEFGRIVARHRPDVK